MLFLCSRETSIRMLHALSRGPRHTVQAAALRPLSLFSRLRDVVMDGGGTSNSYPDPTEVCVVDPRAVLEGAPDAAASVSLHLPAELLPSLSKGINQLGDMDDPMDEWFFGKQAEIFQYRLVGVTSTQSGFTSLITADALARARAREAPLPAWEAFRQEVMAGAARFPSRHHPFLFAGHMVECAEAAVYQLVEDGKIVGLLVSSEAAG